VCLGHSGSTLLGNMLGSHNKGFHIGELVSPIKKGKPIVCRNCVGKPCPIWGSVLTEKFIKKVYLDFSSSSFYSSIFNYSGKIYTKLFRQFNQLQFIVDSSKNIEWYKYNAQNKNYRHKYIFLKRNPSAIIASFKRGYNEDIEIVIPRIKGIIHQLNNFFMEISLQDKILIEYEDLIIKSEDTLSQICQFLGINYEESLNDFNSIEHHLIGGNQGLIIQQDHQKAKALDQLIDIVTPVKTVEFYKSIQGLQLDERWKTELTDVEKNIIDADLQDAFTY